MIAVSRLTQTADNPHQDHNFRDELNFEYITRGAYSSAHIEGNEIPMRSW